MRTSDFNYDLPSELIAQHPAAQREDARLMVLSSDDNGPRHRRFSELCSLLPAGALLIVNDTKVIPARLKATKPTGGKVEILLCERESTETASGTVSETWRCLIKSHRRLSPGTLLSLLAPDAKPSPLLAPPTVRYLGRDGARIRTSDRTSDRSSGDAGIGDTGDGDTGDGDAGDGDARIEIGFAADSSLLSLLEQWGAVPLPPYIERAEGATNVDRQRYQTVYACAPGAVAAPTAGLHFSPQLLDDLRASGFELASITLHVGPGTFSPVRNEDPSSHVMHRERFFVPAETAAAHARARAAGKPIVAVGTTVVRTLESACDHSGALTIGPGETRLFITPGYRVRTFDSLVTNFHLPRSTLLMLVCAFAGTERVLAAYREAVSLGYRFFSYGDAMLLSAAGGPQPKGSPRAALSIPTGRAAPPHRGNLDGVP
ncbi:MAG: tRNA preQ1(34) S-adenosylmethionine ribosyltransferase-isomerase QueA, partial [Pseudomonadota bacterium]